jgi:hypothetical protein
MASTTDHEHDPAPRPKRRTFPAEYKLRIVAEYDAAPNGCVMETAVAGCTGLSSACSRGRGRRMEPSGPAGAAVVNGAVGFVWRLRTDALQPHQCVSH